MFTAMPEVPRDLERLTVAGLAWAFSRLMLFWAGSFLLLVYGSLQVYQGQRIDNRVLVFVQAAPDSVVRIEEHLRLFFIMAPVLVVLLGLAAAFLGSHRQWGLSPGRFVLLSGALAALIFGGAFAAKRILPRASFGIGSPHNSLPSGHVTLAVFLAGALLVFAASTGLGLVRWGAIFLATSIVMTIGIWVQLATWHRPSDVLAAGLLALVFSNLFVAGYSRWVLFQASVSPAEGWKALVFRTVLRKTDFGAAVLGVLCTWGAFYASGAFTREGVLTMKYLPVVYFLAGGTALVFVLGAQICVSAAVLTGKLNQVLRRKV